MDVAGVDAGRVAELVEVEATADSVLAVSVAGSATVVTGKEAVNVDASVAAGTIVVAISGSKDVEPGVDWLGEVAGLAASIWTVVAEVVCVNLLDMSAVIIVIPSNSTARVVSCVGCWVVAASSGSRALASVVGRSVMASGVDVVAFASSSGTVRSNP